MITMYDADRREIGAIIILNTQVSNQIAEFVLVLGNLMLHFHLGTHCLPKYPFLDEEERAGCFALIAHLVSYDWMSYDC